MAPIPRRHLTLLDAMILIVAMSAVLPASRQVWAKTVWRIPEGRAGLLEILWHDARSVALGLSPGLASVTIALTALQWRRPRLAARLLPRSPGLAACAAATLVLLAEVPFGVEAEGTRYLRDFSTWWLPFSTRNAGAAVAGAWMALATVGRWRRDRGHLDRAGVVVGAFWIISYLLTFHADAY